MIDLNRIRNDEGEILQTMLTTYEDLFNSKNRVMAALRDYYELAKSADSFVNKQLQRDLYESALIGSDLIKFELNSLEGTIISYHGSTVTSPQERKVLIPDYSKGASINDVLASQNGLKYMQVLFDTGDGAQEIKETLSRLSGKMSEQTIVKTPPESPRSSTLHMAVSLDAFEGNEFCISIRSLGAVGRARMLQYK